MGLLEVSSAPALFLSLLEAERGSAFIQPSYIPDSVPG